MKAVILAAGIGSRLGRPYPKALCKLPDGQTIIARQIKLLQSVGIYEIIVVVGFKMSLIMEHVPSVLFKYNPLYYVTNTSKSLLAGLENINDDVIWMNGDVLSDNEAIRLCIKISGNVIAVDTKKCGAEEVKYSLNTKGYIKDISKTVKKGLGEAVGINKISKKDIVRFRGYLNDCAPGDYFERGIELAIKEGIAFKPVDISDCKCIEIDSEQDFNSALNIFFDEKKHLSS